MNAPRKAVVLLSGGLDSSTTLAIAREQGFELWAISFDYGQKHRFELDAARRLAQAFDVKKHVIVKIDLGAFGGSALTSDIEVPKDRSTDQMEAAIPITYVPARNTVFLSTALGWAETLDCSDLFIGVNAVDYSGYPDCRPEFVEAFTRLANLATKTGVEGTADWKVHAPLIDLTKADIIRKGTALGVDYAMTHTCYDPNEAGLACGHCDACQLRLQGFEQAGLSDPAAYQ
ncbi:7-cyano-7-deazaguanine synthase QueC [Rubinisphaera brasiliensis]|uniref:7-cyano-7-deazaguanine synthase n=1 Tax=Rubinisphaera brasiliensis (strain ATCC 49424 / DSM 5305 / JCM 21570 / IAM 15109 / NBRC 103401 / IFAM 1448) TaxID=756272 RepID=F0SME1_RUBBR|nr:7-cyano-7-deazaguanine synthase QueC [Rubinisphaera brasiliensis]ADY62120.1 preQ(0) biosynthesis protein QueC [Rubinisphaera brasiliensis DSM 5305]